MSFLKNAEEKAEIQKQKDILENYKTDLKNVFTLLKNKEFWCKRAMARDKNGEQLFSPWDENAVSVCFLGALYLMNAKTETIDFVEKNVKANGFPSIDRFNDMNDYDDVLEFIVSLLQYLKVPIKMELKK